MIKNEKLCELAGKCEDLMNNEKNFTLCFTGHRCQKLPWRFNEKDTRCKNMKVTVKQKIEEAVLQGYKVFISGMAIGFDMICAELVLKLKKKYPYIEFVAALPCKDQDCKWTWFFRKRYKKILEKADNIWWESEHYTEGCMLRRNDFMLNSSSKVIALYDGLSGGTSYTLKKAKEKGLEIIIIKP